MNRNARKALSVLLQLGKVFISFGRKSSALLLDNVETLMGMDVAGEKWSFHSEVVGGGNGENTRE